MPQINAPLPSTFGSVGPKSWSIQRPLNCYLQPAESDTKTPTIIRPSSGLKLRAQPANGEIRGVYMWKGYPYWVAGDGLYKMDATYTLTQIAGVGLNGSGPVSIGANATQMAIIEPVTNDMFVVSGDPLTIAPQTDGDFAGAKSFDVLDSIGIYEIPNSDEFGTTAPGDFASVNALDFASAERNPDLNVRILVDHAELWVFGAETIEVFQNVGGDFPFRRLPGGLIERGLAARFGVVKEDNTVLWIGNDGSFYRATDYTPQRISNHAIEEQIEGEELSDCEATVWTERGHKFVAWRFPSLKKCFVYDIATGLWHERASGDTSAELWIGRFACHAFGKSFIGGLDGNIYEIDANTRDENGALLRSQMTFAPIYAGGKRVRHLGLDIEMEVGRGLTTGQGSDPQIALDWSDDGHTWSNEHWRSIGKIGEYRARVRWQRLGAARERSYRLTITDPVDWALMDAKVMAEGSTV
jgi:hypothetical protein